MDLIQMSKKLNRRPDELESFLKSRGTRIFDETFPLGNSLVNELEREFGKKMSHVAAQRSIQKIFDKRDTELLENCIRDKYHIVIDTCSILRRKRAFQYFYKDCKPLLEKYGCKLQLPYSVCAELGSIICSQKDYETRKRAHEAVNLIKEEINRDYIEILGSRDDTWTKVDGSNGYFADSDFTIQILAWRNNGENVLLITQDHSMTESILKISDLPCVKSTATVLVRKLDHMGILVDAMEPSRLNRWQGR